MPRRKDCPARQLRSKAWCAASTPAGAQTRPRDSRWQQPMLRPDRHSRLPARLAPRLPRRLAAAVVRRPRGKRKPGASSEPSRQLDCKGRRRQTGGLFMCIEISTTSRRLVAAKVSALLPPRTPSRGADREPERKTLSPAGVFHCLRTGQRSHQPPSAYLRRKH